jgi:predicted nucleic acid-binding protein
VDRFTEVEPTIWRLEVANAFQSASRRKRIDDRYRDESLAELAQMAITIDSDTDTYAWMTALRMAERFALTVYDAAYLEIAQRRNLPLASRDRQVQRAGAAAGVTLIGGEPLYYISPARPNF